MLTSKNRALKLFQYMTTLLSNPNPTSPSASQSQSHPDPSSSSTSHLPTGQRRRHPRPQPHILSQWSSPAIPSSGYACEDFMLGVGMVIIQPSTDKVVIVHESKKGYWFLPRGRKDVGETIQEAALREAYEESGYQPTFFPLYTPHHQPAPPSDPGARTRPNTEAVYMSIDTWGPRYKKGKCVNRGGEYFISWFVGRIEEDATHHPNTGMPDEQDFVSHLVSFDRAIELLKETSEESVVRYVRRVYGVHSEVEEEVRREERVRVRERELEVGIMERAQAETEAERKEGRMEERER